MKEICKTDDADLQDNGWKSFDGPGGKPGIILKVGKEYRGFMNVCTHMGGPTLPVEREGGGILKCQWHGAEFDLNGRALTRPAPAGSLLRPLTLEVKDGVIYYT